MPRRNQDQDAYQPRLPSDNALDYYLKAGQILNERRRGFAWTGKMPLTREEVRWIEMNQDAFELLRQGTRKQYTYVFPIKPNDTSLGSFLPRVRNLARLVEARIRWAIATKDGSDAVNDWRIGFKMARDLQGDLLMPYLVGNACEAIVHSPIVREMDFFSAHECRLIAEELIRAERTPDRFNTVVENELKMALEGLNQFLPDDPNEFLRLFETEDDHESDVSDDDVSEDDFEEDPQEVLRPKSNREALLHQARGITNNPTAYRRLREDLRREIVCNWQIVADSIQLKNGKYRPPREPEYDEATLFGEFAVLLSPPFGIGRNYWFTRVRRRLMTAHLLLRIYYLRERRYPSSLDELRLGELAIDPFSGHPLIYRLDGERYLLYSVGFNGRDDGGLRKPASSEQPDEHDIFLTRDGWR